MVTAQRESSRKHALDIANCVGSIFDAKKKTDWEQFMKTGAMKTPQPIAIPSTPLVLDAIDRIKKNGGRFILESN